MSERAVIRNQFFPLTSVFNAGAPLRSMPNQIVITKVATAAPVTATPHPNCPAANAKGKAPKKWNPGVNCSIPITRPLTSGGDSS